MKSRVIIEGKEDFKNQCAEGYVGDFGDAPSAVIAGVPTFSGLILSS